MYKLQMYFDKNTKRGFKTWSEIFPFVVSQKKSQQRQSENEEDRKNIIYCRAILRLVSRFVANVVVVYDVQT